MNIMEQLLQNRELYPQLDHYFNQLSQQEQQYFMEKIQNMKREQLYKSPIHGVYHSEKVCLFAYLLAHLYHLDEIDTEIITDAAIYHDFKRNNDFEDSFHGMVSAEHIEEILPLRAVYSNRVNLLLLKSIIDYHSQSDKRLRTNFLIYDLPYEEMNRYEMLAKILKDADDLDRKRFIEQCQAALNPNFLRLEESKNMIGLAEEINRAYRQIIEQNQTNDIPLDREIGGCLHSIGFDFFRIKSVLKNGILSFAGMKSANLSFPRNFDGGNLERWVSVVPTSTIANNDIAFRTFIKNGIAFYCTDQIYYCPLDFNQKATAYLKGFPYDKSGYLDERYVLSKINPSNIITIFVTKEYAEKGIVDLTYLYNTLHYPTLQNKIIYLLNQMDIKSIDEVPALIEPLACYKKVLEQYEMADFMEKIELAPNLEGSLNHILCMINSVIQSIIKDYYQVKLGYGIDRKILVKDIIKYELFQLYHEADVEIVEGDEEFLIVINKEKKKILK